MIKAVLFVICLCATSLFTEVKGVINVCVPLDSSSSYHETESSLVLLEGLEKDLKAKLSAEDDSIYVGHVDIDVTHPAIRLLGTFDDVTVSNLAKFDVCLLDIDVPSSKFDVFNVTIPDLYVAGTYDLTGNIGQLFDIYGAGDFWLEMSDFSIAMTHFNLTMGEEVCFPINIDVRLGRMKNHFYGLLDGDELEDLLNETLEAIASDTVDILWSEFKEAVDGPLEELIDNFLHHKNVAKLLNKILMESEKDRSALLPYCFSSGESNSV